MCVAHMRENELMVSQGKKLTIGAPFSDLVTIALCDNPNEIPLRCVLLAACWLI